MENKLKDLIAQLEGESEMFEDNFSGWHKEIEEEGYAIAGDFFGHSDDCFEKGIEYGEGLKAGNIASLLREILATKE